MKMENGLLHLDMTIHINHKKQFKELYPDIITDDIYNDIIFINSISYRGVSAANSARQKAESYSSGGGGFSSGGGGGGSFGGGGGGGFR